VIARRGLGFKESLPKNYRRPLEDKEFLSYSVARVEDRIAKLKKEIEEEKNEYKGNKLKSELRRLKRELKLLLKFLMDSGKGEPATQEPATPTPATPREMERVRGPTRVGQKSWRVLSVALAFSCLESFREFSLLKRVILLGDWVGVAGRVSPSSWSGDDCTKYVQFCIVWVTRQFNLTRGQPNGFLEAVLKITYRDRFNFSETSLNQKGLLRYPSQTGPFGTGNLSCNDNLLIPFFVGLPTG